MSIENWVEQGAVAPKRAACNILFQHLEPRASNTAEKTFRKICSIYFARFSGVTFLSQNFFIQFTSSIYKFTPQGFLGLKVRTHQREYATSWFFPRRREFALAYSCTSGHYPVWTGARNFNNNNNKRNKRRLRNFAKENGTHDAIKDANLGGTLSTDSPTHEQWRGDRTLVAENHVVESVATL